MPRKEQIREENKAISALVNELFKKAKNRKNKTKLTLQHHD